MDKFRSYEKLKEELKEMHVSIKTDGEIVTGLVTELSKEGANETDRITVLQDLEYYLHQVRFSIDINR